MKINGTDSMSRRRHKPFVALSDKDYNSVK